MEKKRRGIHPFVILFLLVLFGVNLLFFLGRGDGFYGSVTGMFIKEIPIGMNMGLIAFIIQWAILLLVVILAYMKFLKHRSEEHEKIINFVIPSPKSKAETHLDVFYHLLQQKKNLSVGSIAKVFKIPKEKALEWAKILEDHDLAIIEYPAFSDAEVKIKGYEKEKKKLEKQKEEGKKPAQQKIEQSKKEIKKPEEVKQEKEIKLAKEKK
jgi:hypothetical protein